MRIFPVFLSLIACSLAACEWGNDRAELIAEIGGKQLTWKEVSDVVPDNSKAEDSASRADH